VEIVGFHLSALATHTSAGLGIAAAAPTRFRAPWKLASWPSRAARDTAESGIVHNCAEWGFRRHQHQDLR
jgi:hypothetical protein